MAANQFLGLAHPDLAAARAPAGRGAGADDGAGVASGVYLVRLRSGGAALTQALAVVR